MSAADIGIRIRQWADTRRLPHTHLARWLALDQQDSAALLALADHLRLRTGQLISALEMLEEIAVRDRATVAAVLARGEIRRILDGTGSAPGRARALLDQLRAIRFPRLKRTADRLAAEIAALGLPRGITVVLPHDLGSDELRIEISANGGAQLDLLLEAILNKRAGLRRIAGLLGGIDEV
jgi:hypothetical protein